jgi:hypothetical protein
MHLVRSSPISVSHRPLLRSPMVEPLDAALVPTLVSGKRWLVP